MWICWPKTDTLNKNFLLELLSSGLNKIFLAIDVKGNFCKEDFLMYVLKRAIIESFLSGHAVPCNCVFTQGS